MKTFKRKIYSEMLHWKATSNGRRALMVKGARRVGKSTIVQEFAKREYKSYVLIDFGNASSQVKALFDDLSDLDRFFFQLQILTKVSLHTRNSVIVFDEVQLFPPARQAIKYLVSDGRYDYIETGSLIGIRKYIEGIIIPSEETQLSMFPMDYEEFRWAMGDEVSVPMLRTCFDRHEPMGDSVCRQTLRDFRLYMMIGGMPQAVNEYLETNNMALVDEMKRTVLALYEADLRKIDPTGRAAMLFANIPGQLSHGGSRYQISSILDGQRAQDLLPIIEDMKASMMVHVAYHCDDPHVGMSLTKNLERFKLYMNDTGLFVTLCFRDKKAVDNVIYEKLLSDKLDANLGYVYENIVAQTFRTNGYDLYYYTFPSDTSNHNYEVDFMLAHGSKLNPIEVKSSGYSTHASIDRFIQKYSSRVGEKYLIYTKDYRKDKDITLLPVCFAQFL